MSSKNAVRAAPPKLWAVRRYQHVFLLLNALVLGDVLLTRVHHARHAAFQLSGPLETGRSSCASRVTSAPFWQGKLKDWCSSDAPTLRDWIPCEQLQRVSTDNNIILVQTNCGYLDFAMNLWRGYQSVGKNNVLFLAADCHTYAAMRTLVGADRVAKPLSPPDSSLQQAQSFNTSTYRQFTMVRPKIMQYFIERGYNILWQDVDSVPIQDPFQFLPPLLPHVDVVLTSDIKGSTNPKDTQMCSCFVYVMADRPGSLWFLERWHHHTMQGEGLNQPALNAALHDALNATEYGSSQFMHVILPDRFFPNGATLAKYESTAWWAHANWRVGKDAKLAFFREYGLWDADDITMKCSDR